MASRPRILIVDDDLRMCDSLKFLFNQKGYEISTANSGQEALNLLSKERFDIAILDIVLPDINGHQIMEHIRNCALDTAVILITGYDTLESASEALKKGAYNYIKKPFEYDELFKTVQNALRQKKLKHEKEVIKNKLALSEDRRSYLIQNSPDIIYLLDDQGNFKFINNTVERLTGYKVKELIGRPYYSIIYTEDRDKAKWFFNERRTGNRAGTSVELRLTISGDSEQFRDYEISHLTVELRSTGLYDMPVIEKEKKYLGTHGVARDISHRKHLEAQLMQAQKMEAIGTLASGIAHNFNNLLHGIQGNTSLMLMDTDSSHPHMKLLMGIEGHINSATDLTKQLLGFVKGGKNESKPTDLNGLVKKSSEMFGHTKKEIIIHPKYQKEIWPVEVNRGQIEQVLLNFYVNAWQSMPKGGDLYIETENVYLNGRFVKAFKVNSGNFVKISVRDTGEGMDKETQKRVFEPFFTTKKMDGGTGLGLASAYGIIRNHDGIINVYSHPGQGATFNIYLPASEKEIAREIQITEGYVKGSETVLLVDDEDAIIDVGSQLLKKLGYEVLTAQSGEEAAVIFEEHQEKIKLIILDMIMPKISGGETYDKIKEINPDIKVLLSSGYSVDGQASEILDRGCNGFIQKPFNLKNLSLKIRQLIDAEEYALKKH